MKSVSHLTLETHIISYTMINLGNKNKCVAKGCWVNFYLDISVFWVVAYWIKSKKSDILVPKYGLGAATMHVWIFPSVFIIHKVQVIWLTAYKS